MGLYLIGYASFVSHRDALQYLPLAHTEEWAW